MKGRTWRVRKKRKAKMSSSCDSLFSNQETKCLGQWLKANGLRKHQLQPRHFAETGRGMMACCKIDPGDVIISIPNHLLITVDTILSSQLGQALKQSNPKLSLQQALALFILIEREKKECSFWWNYIQSIPRNFSTPGYFTPEEYSMLPEQVKNTVDLHITKLRKAYKQVQTFVKNSCVLDKLKLTFNLFRWAWYAVNSRSVYYEMKCCHLVEKDGNMALAPYLDLLNHSVDAKSEAQFNVKNKCYEIRTWNQYKKFDQVFISYGQHDNLKLFIEYGFTLPNNPNSVYQFSSEQILELATSHKVQYFEHKLKILQENNLLWGLSCSLEGVSWKLETVLKILIINWLDLQRWKQIMLGTVGCSEIDKQSRSLTLSLLTEEMTKTLYQKQNQREALNYHENICKNLLLEDLSILQASIKILT